ncbi:MAG: CDP-alcohol phosphatidyltransferase family protein [Actinomycetota bacterium]|nr:CDP-alcohol phosphatidyltransferase family protein [Actinomycetota bacterium]
MPPDLNEHRLRAAQRYAPRPLTEGERWTADALEELRRGVYRPRAWRRFIGASLERSARARRERPSLARQARIWGAGGAIAWLSACRATRRIEDIELSPARGLAWWLVVWQMLDWHIGMAEGGDGHARARLSPADAVTLARFWLVPAIPAAARSPVGLPALVVIAGVTDWADGSLARRYGRTRLGRDLDTTADLAFIAAASLTAREHGRITPLAFQAIAARYAIGVTIALAAVFGRARRPAIRARPWGALPRFTGLAMCTAGGHRAGTVLVLIGSLVPPRSTAPHLSRA